MLFRLNLLDHAQEPLLNSLLFFGRGFSVEGRPAADGRIFALLWGIRLQAARHDKGMGGGG